MLKVGSTAFLAHSIKENKDRVENCGIVGFVGRHGIADEVLSEGVNLLQNRGYDSTGIVTINQGEFSVDKSTSDFEQGKDCIQEILKIAKEKHSNRLIGLAHTRWATCGEINDLNAHPHFDDKKRIALVHNGTIYNYKDLRKNLEEKGYLFQSQTDTEVIAMQIGFYLD